MIDVAEGEKIPRKGGPGITRDSINTFAALQIGKNERSLRSHSQRVRFHIEKGGLARSAA